MFMKHRTADGLAGGDIPEPRGLIRACGEDRLAIRTEGDGGHQVAVGEDLLEIKVATPPGGQVGQGDVPAGRVAGLGGHPH